MGMCQSQNIELIYMPSIGRARRYECSLTTEELIDEGKYVLNEYREGKEASLDPKYSGIIKDRKIRGHLRCGLRFDSMRRKSGETLKTTVEGTKAVRSEM